MSVDVCVTVRNTYRPR